MILIHVAAASFALLVQAPALQEPQTLQAAQVPQAAQPSAETTAPLSAPNADARDQIVCRSESVTGRRTRARVCRSRAQMRAEADAGQQALRRAQENHRRSHEE